MKSGDTLSGTGKRLGVSWQAVAKANGIGAPGVIEAGQRFKVPGKSSVKPYTPSPCRPRSGPSDLCR